jgi:hypothetical protein
MPAALVLEIPQSLNEFWFVKLWGWDDIWRRPLSRFTRKAFCTDACMIRKYGYRCIEEGVGNACNIVVDAFRD